ncbi:hypothetical protein ACH9ZK_14220 [Lacticaseibacillus paracasei]|uniref:hypothetical protein n=1 Tax=Lacticaseibacillus paracasei TaxID=1597 RepID=UPI0037DFC5F9
MGKRKRLVTQTRNKLLRFGKRALRGASLNDFNRIVEDLLNDRLTTDDFLRLAPETKRDEVNQLLTPLPDPQAHLRPIIWGSRILDTMYAPTADAPIAKVKLAADGTPLLRHINKADLGQQLAYYRALDKAYHHGQPWVPTAVFLQ